MVRLGRCQWSCSQVSAAWRAPSGLRPQRPTSWRILRSLRIRDCRLYNVDMLDAARRISPQSQSRPADRFSKGLTTRRLLHVKQPVRLFGPQDRIRGPPNLGGFFVGPAPDIQGTEPQVIRSCTRHAAHRIVQWLDRLHLDASRAILRAQAVIEDRLQKADEYERQEID